jgi:hypothetical protein
MKNQARISFSVFVKEIEKTFGRELHIGNGRIYEQNGDEFVLFL